MGKGNSSKVDDTKGYTTLRHSNSYIHGLLKPSSSIPFNDCDQLSSLSDWARSKTLGNTTLKVTSRRYRNHFVVTSVCRAFRVVFLCAAFVVLKEIQIRFSLPRLPSFLPSFSPSSARPSIASQSQASVLMQRLFYPIETVLSNKITHSKARPRKPLRRRPCVSHLQYSSGVKYVHKGCIARLPQTPGPFHLECLSISERCSRNERNIMHGAGTGTGEWKKGAT